jgi:hypothetical protein
MTKVTGTSTGYAFENLSAVGKRLVNEFQRHHPELCMPSSEPSYRFIRCGSPQQDLLLGKLADDVRTRDPEPKPKPPAFKKRARA